MDIAFEGFQSPLPIWLFGLLAAAVIGLSWWSYSHLRSTAWRRLLTGIRAASLLILLVLLLNPFFRSEQITRQPPEILLLLDNSASAGIEKSGYAGRVSYMEALEQMALADDPALDIRLYRFSREVGEIPSVDSLTFDGEETNLYNLFDLISERRREARAAVIVSDGIHTIGRTPVFESGRSSLPVFTVGIGDTTSQRDLFVRNVVTNTTGYLDTRHPVEVTVGSDGFRREPFDVQLIRGGSVIATQTVTPRRQQHTATLTFEPELRETGLQQYTVSIPPKAEEWTDGNNIRPFSIDVLDDKQRVLSVAFEIHPDVRFVRSLLLGDENSRLYRRTWTGGSRFIGGAFDFDPDTLDLVILHGFPGPGVPSAVTGMVSRLAGEVPLLYFNMPSSDLRNLQQELDIPLPVEISVPESDLQVSLHPAVEPTAHPVMELPGVTYTRMPPLFAPVTGLSPAERAVTLFESSYQGTRSGSPLVSVMETGNLRAAAVTGYGWYRVAQSAGAGEAEFAAQLLVNLVQWTATRPDNRLLVVEPSSRTFSGREPVILNAYLRNERGEEETDASIRVSLQGEGMEERFWSMDHTGGGQYRLEIPPLSQGVYRYEATATMGDRTIDERSGEIAVDENRSELVDTRRNDRILRQLAEQSGGVFFTHDRLEGFRDSLSAAGVLQPEERVVQTLFFPYRYLHWFVAVLMLLTAEWLLRKYLSLP